MSFSSEVREELLELKMWDNNSSLKQDEQMIINLVLKGKNQRTIAKTMNCCQPTISRKIKLILIKLKKSIEKDDGILKNA